MELIENRIDELNAEWVIRIEKEDYFAEWDEALKKARKQVNIPGFRNGKVPQQVIQKRYGSALLADTLEKILNQQLNKHIETNQVDLLGGPLPKESSDAPGNWENPDIFQFVYQVGLAPQFSVNISGEPCDYYTIKVDDGLVSRQMEDVRRRYGKLSDVDVVEDKDLILGNFSELLPDGNVVEGGISHDSSISLEFIDESSRKPLQGLKVGDSVDLDPFSVSKGEADTAAMLGITKDQLSGIAKMFRFTVKSIKRMQLAEVNQDLFDKIFGEDQVHTEEEMKERIKADFEGGFKADSDRLLYRHFRKSLLEKYTVSLPEEFLKKWIVSNDRDQKITPEVLEQEFGQYSEYLRWQLIESKLVKEYNLEITDEELVSATMSAIAGNYQRYGMPIPAAAELEKHAREVLQKREERDRVVNMVSEQKLMSLFKSEVSLNTKELSYDDFVAIAQQS
jgi:trigger factor